MFKLIGRDPEKLREYSQEAYDALPAPYKASSCMYYFMSGVNDELYSHFDLGGVYWFDPYELVWREEISSGVLKQIMPEPPGEWVRDENGLDYILNER